MSMMKTSAPELSFMAARSRPPLPRMRLQKVQVEVVEVFEEEWRWWTRWWTRWWKRWWRR